MSTTIGRKCKDCRHFKNNWCDWKGTSRRGTSTECDDGWCDPKQFKDSQFMATTYDYQTGKIERDFKFVRYGEKCKRSGLPCYAGSTNRCEKCQHYGGLITPWEMREFTWRNLGDDSYVVCKHPDAQDSKDSEHFISIWYEYFRNEAISHYYD